MENLKETYSFYILYLTITLPLQLAWVGLFSLEDQTQSNELTSELQMNKQVNCITMHKCTQMYSQPESHIKLNIAEGTGCMKLQDMYCNVI